MKDPYKKIVKPKTEAEFQEFLDRHNVRYDRQVLIGDCPFNVSFNHRVDFYLEDFDLYVEVKGWMSCAAVSELWWLLNYCSKNFYIYQVTNEDWMGRCIGGRDAKIACNISAQQDELTSLFKLEPINAKEKIKSLVELNRRRLKDFIKVRQYDVLRWRQMLRHRSVESGKKGLQLYLVK